MKTLKREDFLNWWLKKYHNISVSGVINKYPNEIRTPDWFKLFPVTQDQHDEWYNWAIDTISKELKVSKSIAKQKFAFDYLDSAPYVNKNIKNDNK